MANPKVEAINKNITSETVLVTPEYALKLLENQSPEVKNRNVSQSRVEMMARSIRKGEWIETHQGIALDTQGFLLDGQHRLWAIVEAKTPALLMVTKGLDRISMTVIDRGRSRSLGDVLAIAGHTRGSRKAAIARMLGSFLKGKGDGDPKYGRLLDSEIMTLVDRYESELDWFCKLKATGPFASSPIAACFVYTKSKVSIAIEPIAEKFLLGTHLNVGDPMHAMRQHLIRNTTDSYLRRFAMRMSLMRFMFVAIARSLQGKRMERVTNDSMEGFDYISKVRDV